MDNIIKLTVAFTGGLLALAAIYKIITYFANFFDQFSKILF